MPRSARLAVALLLLGGCATADLTQTAQGHWKSGDGLTLALAPGQISGSTGCNRFSGPARVEHGRLISGPLASTRMMCPPDTMRTEAELLDFLAGQPTIAREADTLVLDSGQRRIVLHPKRAAPGK